METAGRSKRGWLLVVTIGLALWLSGCGGGGGGGEGGSDPVAGQLSLAQRIDAVDRMSSRLEQIAGNARPSPAQWEELRAWTVAQPEFTDAGVGDQLLWARFADGRYFLYTDNWQDPPQAEARALAPLQKAGLLKQDVPASANALVLRLDGDDFDPGDAAMQRMRDALDLRGWKVGTSSLTISALKNAGELGFLFMTTHSGILGRDDTKEFAAMTQDIVSDALEKSYAEDLEEGKLIWHRDHGIWKRLTGKPWPRYSITSKFIAKYLKFSPESLVILLSCQSGAAQAQGFRDALTTKGAGTIVAWDGNATRMAFPSMDLLVDRLTGANAVSKTDPPNRAFNFEDVWSYLDKNGHLKTLTDGGLTPVVRFGSGFTKLNPIVAELEVPAPDKLVVHGDFGTEPATVTVGEKAFSATPGNGGTTLEVTLDESTHGEVVVTSRDRRSNPRVLGSWRGQVVYTQQYERASCGPVLRDQMTLDLHLRADMHGVRDSVDGPVRNSRRVVMPSSGTKASWHSSGVCLDSQGRLVERWSGQGSLALFFFDTRNRPSTMPVQTAMALARIDPVERRFQLSFKNNAYPLKTVQYAHGTEQEPVFFYEEVQSHFNLGPDFDSLLPGGFMFLPLSPQTAAVLGGTHQKAPPEAPAEVLTVQWGNMPVTPAFDDTIGR